MTRSSPSPPDPAVALLRDLASTPRATGTDAIQRARARVRRELEALGFVGREHGFVFSALPGRFATPAFGAAALTAVAAAGHLGSRGGRVLPLAIVLAAAAVLATLGWWVARRGTLALPFMRESGVNLELTRPGQRPRIWLCAHVDTKSQPVPTLIRASGIIILGAGYLATIGMSVAAAAGLDTPRWAWVATVLVTLAGAVPVVLSVVGNHSSGALDNASGVATVVEAARRLEGATVGILITDAEELGLAGARAWATEHRGRAAIVLNCDGVDDHGGIVVMHARRQPREVLQAAARASADVAVSWRPRRTPLGLLTDSTAFADAGIASVTFSRGGMRSLARVHSRRDDLSRLRGTGVAEVASLMAATVRQLSRNGSPEQEWKS